MVGTNWILLFAVVAVLLHKVVKSSDEIGSEVDERELDDEAMAREVIKRLAEMSDSEQFGDNGVEIEKRAIQKRGWWRRTWRRIKDRVRVRVYYRKQF